MKSLSPSEREELSKQLQPRSVSGQVHSLGETGSTGVDDLPES